MTPSIVFNLTRDFALTTPFLSIRFVPTAGAHSQMQRRGNDFTFSLSAHVDFAHPVYRQWGHELVTNVLRLRATEELPRRVAAYAGRYGLRYNRVVIKNVRTRWGSCSSLGNINLSLWLMLAPEPLVDYVVKHELAHLNEMNHGPRFWAEVDRMCGGPGTGRALEQQMQDFSRHLTRGAAGRSAFH